METLPPPEELRASVNPALVSKLERKFGESRCDIGAECTE